MFELESREPPLFFFNTREPRLTSDPLPIRRSSRRRACLMSSPTANRVHDRHTAFWCVCVCACVRVCLSVARLNAMLEMKPWPLAGFGFRTCFSIATGRSLDFLILGNFLCFFSPSPTTSCLATAWSASIRDGCNTTSNRDLGRKNAWTIRRRIPPFLFLHCFRYLLHISLRLSGHALWRCPALALLFFAYLFCSSNVSPHRAFSFYFSS